MPGPRDVLCLNSGSSSLKFAVYRMSDSEEALGVEGAFEGIGIERGRLWIRDGAGASLEERNLPLADHGEAIRALQDAFERGTLTRPGAVGHRVVHGGSEFRAPALLTPRLRAKLEDLVRFAPLHLPSELAAIRALAEAHPDLPQVACFDTAFHRGIPELALRLALPRQLWDEGVRRYGFHGLSYEYVVEALGSELPERVVIAHLGNGASLVALRGGAPLDTTMGFTPTGGVMMGTRSGDLDPGVLLYLMREKGLDAEGLSELLNHRSGLRGVSETSSDMKTLLQSRGSDPRADQAIRMFCYQVRKQIGALAAALGGLDLLVFTGGIGERAGAVREEICDGLQHLGVPTDPEASGHSRAPGCRVLVVATNEELMIARHTRRIVASGVQER